MKLITVIAALLLTTLSFAQLDSSLFSRLQGISNEGTDFFNVDGIEITSETYTNAFSDEGLKKPFKKYSIKKDDQKTKDSALPFNNYHILKSENISPNLTRYTSYYFFENKDKWLTIVSFAYVKTRDKTFEREFVKHVYSKSIPASVYTPLTVDSINFVGRKIGLGKSCRWMNINSVQCPYYGQMNWSVHKELLDAQTTVDVQLAVTQARKGHKLISNVEVDIVFEDTPVKAKKVVYDITGINSLLAGMSGGKTLTVYYVAAPVRNNFVSCVLSFWNNDKISPSGLPPLLEQVMKLK